MTVRLRNAAGRPAGERGSSTVEYVLITPVLLFAVFTVVQVALWMFARQAVTAAAQHGARAARTSDAPTAAIGVDTSSYLSRVAGDLTAVPDVTVTRTDTTATVTITARTLAVIPGLALHVTGRASGPLETFRPTP